jgi:hypothetical protein
LWKEVIEKDFEKIDGLLLTFAARFTEAMCRLEEPSPQASTAVESPPAPVPAPSAVPSFLQTPAPKEATPPLRAGLLRTALTFDAPPTAALPFQAASASRSTLPEAHATRELAEPRVATGTALAVDGARVAGTPFQGEPGRRPAVAAGAAGASPAWSGSGTAWAPNTPPGPATPFAPAEVLGFNLPRYAELAAARDAAGADPAAMLAEMRLTAAEHDQVEAYWRRKLSEDGMLALQFGRLYTQAKRALAERARVPLASAPGGTSRLFGTGTSLAVHMPQAAVPFASPARAATVERAHEPVLAAGASAPAAPLELTASTPDLSVEQYAWLIASLRRTPAIELPGVLARFRLTAESLRDLETRWAGRMVAEPRLSEAVQAAVARFLGVAGDG